MEVNKKENNDARITRGSCLCGQVAFEIHGQLRDVVNCHCSKCTKFHGTFGAYTRAAVDQLILTETKGLKWYASPTDETKGVQRGFCVNCGSSLFWHPKDHSHISVAAGSLETPTELKTKGHIWCSQISDFYEIEDDLPQFEERWVLSTPKKRGGVVK